MIINCTMPWLQTWHRIPLRIPDVSDMSWWSECSPLPPDSYFPASSLWAALYTLPQCWEDRRVCVEWWCVYLVSGVWGKHRSLIFIPYRSLSWLPPDLLQLLPSPRLQLFNWYWWSFPGSEVPFSFTSSLMNVTEPLHQAICSCLAVILTFPKPTPAGSGNGCSPSLPAGF